MKTLAIVFVVVALSLTIIALIWVPLDDSITRNVRQLRSVNDKLELTNDSLSLANDSLNKKIGWYEVHAFQTKK